MRFLYDTRFAYLAQSFFLMVEWNLLCKGQASLFQTNSLLL